MARGPRRLFALFILLITVPLCAMNESGTREEDGAEPNNEHGTSPRTGHGLFHYVPADKVRYSSRQSSSSPSAAVFGAAASGTSDKETLDNSGFRYEYTALPNDRDHEINSIFGERETKPPTNKPTFQPSKGPTGQPTLQPTKFPTGQPTVTPTNQPTGKPTKVPAEDPTSKPTKQPADSPTVKPTKTDPPTPPPQPLPAISFDAGDFSAGKRSDDGIIFLSNGLSARAIARAGEYVKLADESTSSLKFHKLPDGADVFKKRNGGWLYASNAENDSRGSNWDDGGVGVLDFNANGDVVGYYRIANETKHNCGGGKTAWNSWITCEETGGGQVIQTDPYGKQSPVTTAMGSLGSYESFTYWYDDGTPKPMFYVTRDQDDGVITRFTPDDAAMECFRKTNKYERWCTLESGTIDYLHLKDNDEVEWTTDYDRAKRNAKELYPNSEGIDVHDGVLYFTSKVEKRLLIVNLRKLKYTYSSTKSGAFNNQPDQIEKVLGSDAELLFLCEDGGTEAGLHGRDVSGRYFTILYADKDKIKDHGLDTEETTGLGISPDAMHLYVSFQHIGIIYDVTRDDKRPFNGALLDIKYHAR